MAGVIDLIPPEMWGLDLAIAAAAVLAAGLVRGFSGFGSAMVNAPVLSLLWGPTIGVPIAALVEFVPAVQLTPRAIPIAQWRTILVMGVPALILIPAGLWLLVTLPNEVVRRFVAAVVLGLVAVMWSGWRYRGKRTAALSLGVGALSGLLSGNDDLAVIRANMIGFFTIVLIGMAVTFALGGLFGPLVLWRAALLAVPFVIGIYAGARLFPLASQRTFRNIALTFLAVSSSYVLFA